MLFALLLACTADEKPAEMAVEIPFSLRMGNEDFGCGIDYEGVGTSATTVEALDARFYVYDVTLIAEDGTEALVALDQDGVWQRDNLALLDFEDGSASCETGSPATRTVVTGTVPEGDWHGLRFTMGVPSALNHLDAATSAPPLNVTGLWWSWAGGYKYARIDVATPTNPAFYFHLGATDCVGDAASGYECAKDNLPTIELAEFHPGESRVVYDLATFYGDSDLDAPPDNVTDFVSGCMAFTGDGECDTILAHLGLPWEASTTAPEADVFSVEAL
jgi:uncharacterized repeat protein (TIGR04052 family)